MAASVQPAAVLRERTTTKTTKMQRRQHCYRLLTPCLTVMALEVSCLESSRWVIVLPSRTTCCWRCKIAWKEDQLLVVRMGEAQQVIAVIAALGGAC